MTLDKDSVQLNPCDCFIFLMEKRTHGNPVSAFKKWFRACTTYKIRKIIVLVKEFS